MDCAGYRSEQARIVLTAVGSSQLMDLLRASRRLAERKIAHAAVYLLELIAAAGRIV